MLNEPVYLPNGQSLAVTAVFGGYTFKASQLDLHHSAFPPGWTVILQTEGQIGETDEKMKSQSRLSAGLDSANEPASKPVISHRLTHPTLQHDTLFLSSISIPSSSDFKLSSSPTRQIALMLWSTLYWYFHKDPPSPHIKTSASASTPETGQPKAEWKIRIKREGILKGRNRMQKLERMGLVATEESSVGRDPSRQDPDGWNAMFVSRKAFWQIDPRIFLFTLSPVHQSPFPAASPLPSRPGSPTRDGQASPRTDVFSSHPDAITAGISSPGGPYNSGSHLPTYYPPAPTQYVFSNHIRHPVRPKPPRPGETFYTRFIPSLEQFLSLRTPTLSEKPCPHFAPTEASSPGLFPAQPNSAHAVRLPTVSSFAEKMSDLEILHRWMNEPRVNAAWGCGGPLSTQQKFLEDGLSSRHSFPVIGCWDGRPFGYFEVYWVKEDKLGRLLGGHVGDHARGIHVLVGEQEFRGPHRVKVWLDALVHYCWLADNRTETIYLEPRVDNTKFIAYLHQSGFYKQGEVTFPHKQSAVMKIDRESWEAPSL